MKPKQKPPTPSKTRRHLRPGPRAGTHVVWPLGVNYRYDITTETRWRWERAGLLPPRDVNVAGKTGWLPATLDAWDRRPISAQDCAPKREPPGRGKEARA